MERISTLLIATQMCNENGKTKHKTVLCAVRKLFGDRIINEPMGRATLPITTQQDSTDYNTYVFQSSYVDKKGRNKPMYLLTKEQALVICGTFTRKNIVKLFDYIYKLEDDRMKLLQERTQLLEQQNVLLLEDKTKYENLVNTNGTYTATEVGMDVGMDVQKFNKFLCEKRIQRREGNQWILNPSYANKGYGVNRVAQITHSNGETETVSYLVWTNKGRDFIINELCKHL